MTMAVIYEHPEYEIHEIIHPQVGRRVVLFEIAAAVMAVVVVILVARAFGPVPPPPTERSDTTAAQTMHRG
jgi:hypothetical protein